LKRMLCLIMILFGFFGLSSCSAGTNMEKLTDYQNKDFKAAAYITLDGVKYKAEVSKQGSAVYFSFNEPKNLANFVFIVNDGKISVKAGTLTVPIDAGEDLLSISKLSSLFRIPVSGTWKINKEALGGVAVYVCRNENEDTVMYIDAGSRCPLKIICRGTEANIISFAQ